MKAKIDGLKKDFEDKTKKIYYAQQRNKRFTAHLTGVKPITPTFQPSTFDIWDIICVQKAA